MKLLYTIALILIVLAGAAQDVIPTNGKEFWVGFLQNWESNPNEDELLNLFITSDVNTTGIVEIPGQGWTQNFTVTANQTTTVTIPNNLAEHFTSEQVEAKGVFVATQDTVAVFAINFQAFTADATRILPTPSLGTEYRPVSYRSVNTSASISSEFLIVATEDDTEIEITPTALTNGGNPAGVPFTIQLNRGESYQVKAANEALDLTGSLIQGTEESGDCRPFAVFSGSVCSNIPNNCIACDHIYDQNFPTRVWGSEFVVAPFDFTDSYTFRVLAHEDNTVVTISGIGTVNLDAGEFAEYNSQNQARCITSNQGICAVQYMEGVGCAGNGDPAMIILNASDQKIDNITFSTVDSNVITQHSITLIVDASDVATVELDGALVPAASFTPFANCNELAYAYVNIAEGSHTVNTPNGAIVYVYGAGDAESYAYSAGSYTPPPPIEVDEALCSDGVVELAVEDGQMDVIWYAESDPDVILGNGPILTLQPPIITDIYVAVGNQFLSGCEIETFFSVENPEPIDVVAGPDAQSICQFQGVQLQATVLNAGGNYQFQWEPAAGLDNPNIANPVATPMETTTYTVTVSTLTGCSSGTAELTIEVIPGILSSFEATPNQAGICFGDQVDLNLDFEAIIFEDNFDPGISWGLWNDISNGAASEDCGSVNGNALYFNGNGNRFALTEAIDVSNGGSILFALKIGSDVAPCDNADPGEDVVLEYSTTGPAGPFTIIDTYFEQLYPDFTTVEVDIPAAAQTAATHFRWRQLANSGNNQDNWAMDEVVIGATSLNDPNVSWTPATGLSDPDSFSPVASPEEDTMYYISLIDTQSGCEYIDSVFVSVTPEVNLTIPADTSLCGPGQIALEVVPDYDDTYTYAWTGQAITNPFNASTTANPSQSGSYSVTVVSSAGCEFEESFDIIVGTLNSLDLQVDETNLCVGESTDLNAIVDADGPVSYAWLPSESLSADDEAAVTATPPATTTYTIEVTDIATGCVLSESVEIVAEPAFTIDAGEDLVLCEVVGLQLQVTTDAETDVTYSWNNAAALDDASSASPIVQQDASLDFTVVATNDGGCTAQDEISITLVFEEVDLGPDLEACVGDELTLSSGDTSGAQHLWSTGESSDEITVTTSGTYEVELTSDLGCTIEDEVTVTFFDPPAFDLGVDPGLCDGESHTLSVNLPGHSFLWNNGSTNAQITVNQSGTFSVTATSNLGCENTESIDLVFHPLPVLDLEDEITVCEDVTVILDPGNDGAFYDWSTGESTQSIEATESGFFEVTVTSAENCSSSGGTLVEFVPYPFVDLGADQLLCQGESADLNAGNPQFDVTWSTGETANEITVNTTGLYTVAVDNGYCISTDEVSMTFSPLPENPNFPDTAYCFVMPPYSFQLNALNPGSSYQWSTGSTDQTISFNQEGTYSVTITTAFGCSLSFDHIAIQLCPGYSIFIPNAFTPDNDGVNDVWRAEGTNIEDWEMTVWNRWGERIWESNDFNEVWNGSYKNRSHYVEAENYLYRVRFRYRDEVSGVLSEWIAEQGHVTVIR